MAAAMRAFLDDAADHLEKEARRALAAVSEGDTLRTQLMALKRFNKREPVNSIGLRRQVAEAVLTGDRYPFECK
jgi:hypothetical protein